MTIKLKKQVIDILKFLQKKKVKCVASDLAKELGIDHIVLMSAVIDLKEQKLGEFKEEEIEEPIDVPEDWFDTFLDKARKKLIRTQYLKDYLQILEIIYKNQRASFDLIGNKLNVSYPVPQRKYFLNFLAHKL